MNIYTVVNSPDATVRQVVAIYNNKYAAQAYIEALKKIDPKDHESNLADYIIEVNTVKGTDHIDFVMSRSVFDNLLTDAKNPSVSTLPVFCFVKDRHNDLFKVLHKEESAIAMSQDWGRYKEFGQIISYDDLVRGGWKASSICKIIGNGYGGGGSDIDDGIASFTVTGTLAYPQEQPEQPEQLTVYDFHGALTENGYTGGKDYTYSLTEEGRDKLIRMSKRLGKGEV